jgi:Protein of unknown function (DUF2510)
MSQGPPTSGGGVDPQQQPAQPAVPAGWYPHPTAPGWEAYWDGAAWGAETRPAAAAPAVPDPAAQQDPAQDPAAQQQAAIQDPTAQQAAGQDPGVTDPAAEGAADQDPATAVQPEQSGQVAGPGAAAATGAAAVSASQHPAAVPSDESTTAPSSEPAAVPSSDPAAGVPAPAVPVAQADKRSDSSLPLVLCLLGAIVAIVGSFLPMASIDTFDLADNTLVGQTYGLGVIAVAVIGAIIAAYSYLKAYRTWIVILLGAVIVAIAAYAGLVGVDDVEISGLPNLQSLEGNGGQTPDPQALDEIAKASQGDPSPSTGIFVTALGGLLMVLGGVGIARQPK